jgi:hypothetical protein
MKANLIAAAVACALAGPALAQDPPASIEREIIIHAPEVLAAATEAKATAQAWRERGDDMRASLGTMFGDHLGGAQVVKGAPYSAEVVTEISQALADGNVISRKTSGRVYRDGEGRTRQETIVGGESKSIQLRDPVAGNSVMLLPGSKKAVRSPHVALHADAKEVQVLRIADKEIRIENGKVSVDGKEVAGVVELKSGGKEIRVANGRVTIDGKEASPSAGGKRKVIVKRVDAGESGDGTVREEVRVQVIRGGDGRAMSFAVPPVPPVPPVAPVPPFGGSFGWHVDRDLAGSRAVITSLGEKEFDGVKAEGKLATRTIPAGAIGNRNAIVVTRETWYSPQLKLTVYSRSNDPRRGETVFRLANIRRGEPPADLFKVPEEYAAPDRRAKG